MHPWYKNRHIMFYAFCSRNIPAAPKCGVYISQQIRYSTFSNTACVLFCSLCLILQHVSYSTACVLFYSLCLIWNRNCLPCARFWWFPISYSWILTIFCVVFCLFVIFLCFVPIIACVSGCFILNSPLRCSHFIFWNLTIIFWIITYHLSRTY